MRKQFLLLFLFSICIELCAQHSADNPTILFYNVENLFDTQNDSLTLDDEFLPDGKRHWTRSRFQQKVNHLSKVILSCSGFNPPAIIGLCEVENRYVLEQLTQETPLKKLGYLIIHKDSPDERGIDVALLFRPEIVKPLYFSYHPVIDGKGGIESTREILQAGFALPKDDTVHVFVNHWPSRYSGQAKTAPKRMRAAQTLQSAIMELREESPRAKLIVMGDFNDGPESASLLELTKQKAANSDSAVSISLANLSKSWQQGTLKYRQSWFVFDQILVSQELMEPNGWFVHAQSATIVNLPFLLIPDSKYQGMKLNRTYNGFRYQGGFSDHLPVLLKLSYQ